MAGAAPAVAPAACANCGAGLLGAGCSACGQRAHLERSLRGALHELVHGLLHLDGKLWRTLPLLVLRPGRPTRAWIEGQRARHLSPVALFQSSIFLMFIVLGLAGPPARLTVRVDRGQALTMLAGAERQAVDFARGLDPKAAPALPAAARRALREAHAEAAALGQELATAPGPGGPWIEVPAD